MPYYLIKKKKLKVSNNRFVIHDRDCPRIKKNDKVTDIGFHTEQNAALLYISLKRPSAKFFLCKICCKVRS